jgi:hypothetical protein
MNRKRTLNGGEVNHVLASELAVACKRWWDRLCVGQIHSILQPSCLAGSPFNRTLSTGVHCPGGGGGDGGWFVAMRCHGYDQGVPSAHPHMEQVTLSGSL